MSLRTALGTMVERWGTHTGKRSGVWFGVKSKIRRGCGGHDPSGCTKHKGPGFSPHRELVPFWLLMGFVPAGRSSSAISSVASDSLI